MGALPVWGCERTKGSEMRINTLESARREIKRLKSVLEGVPSKTSVLLFMENPTLESLLPWEFPESPTVLTDLGLTCGKCGKKLLSQYCHGYLWQENEETVGCRGVCFCDTCVAFIDISIYVNNKLQLVEKPV